MRFGQTLTSCREEFEDEEEKKKKEEEEAKLAEEAAAAAEAPADPPAAEPVEDDPWGSFATAGKKKKGKKGKVAEPEPVPEPEPEPEPPAAEPEPEPAAPEAAADDVWGFTTSSKKKKKKGKVSRFTYIRVLHACKMPEGCLTATWCDYPGRAYSKRASWWLTLALHITLHTALHPNVSLCANEAHATPH